MNELRTQKVVEDLVSSLTEQRTETIALLDSAENCKDISRISSVQDVIYGVVCVAVGAIVKQGLENHLIELC